MSLPRLSPHVTETPSLESVVAVGLPTTGIVVSELLLARGFVTASLWGYVVILLVCTLPVLPLDRDGPLLSAFVLLPVFRLVNLAMPVFVEPTIYWLLVIYLLFALAGGVYLRRRKRIRKSTTPRRVVLWSLLALVGGIGIAELQYRFDPPTFLLPAVTTQGLGLLSFVVLLGGAVEELLFRGVVQGTIHDRLGPWVAIAVASLVFAAMRAPFGRVAVGIGLLAGISYGISYIHSRSLVTPLVFHGVVNLLVFVVYPQYGSLATLV